MVSEREEEEERVKRIEQALRDGDRLDLVGRIMMIVSQFIFAAVIIAIIWPNVVVGVVIAACYLIVGDLGTTWMGKWLDKRTVEKGFLYKLGTDPRHRYLFQMWIEQAEIQEQYRRWFQQQAQQQEMNRKRK